MKLMVEKLLRIENIKWPTFFTKHGIILKKSFLCTLVTQTNLQSYSLMCSIVSELNRVFKYNIPTDI